VALGRGGVTETVLPGQTGLLFDEQTVECLLDAVRMFESAGSFDPRRCRENALRFDVPRFREQFARFVADEQAAFASRRSAGATEPDRTPRG
ncbi:MAG TPA: glycosyl transferase family 1, partial [Phycisphaerales bacterium]|nr:glycosyl transferase family 1 [Phycisphaerales bacterium]